MAASAATSTVSKKLGIVIGGSGLIGGALTYYFSKQAGNRFEILSPNSKRLSLRVKEDISAYFQKYRPDFIINAAIATIDSDPQLAYETNYIGCINLAKVALNLNIPYFHISTAAVLPNGKEISETERLPLTTSMPNYPKSKLMAELTLEHMYREHGLDMTIIRLGVVYGKHDHKIQGFHRLMFSIADEAMPFLLTRKSVRHSYSNPLKIGPFIHHALDNREEFGGQTYNFVDPEPVQLVELILKIKSILGVSTPRKVFIPYHLASSGKAVIRMTSRALARIGVEVRMPAELLFLENFYKTQVLSSKKLACSSYVDPDPEISVYTELPDMLQYYLTRWAHLNLISSYSEEFFGPQEEVDAFHRTPDSLLASLHQSGRLNRAPDLDPGDLL